MFAPPEKESTKLAAAEINLTAQELADIIWLMVQINLSSSTSEVSPVTTTENSQNISLPSQDTESNALPEIAETTEKTAPLYTDSSRNQVSESKSAGLPIEIADPLALRNTL